VAVFPLSPLWKYASKWGHVWREMDECGVGNDGMSKMISLYSII